MKIRVGVFFGGRSVEHEVSIVSAVQAMYAMDVEKYEIIPVYISKESRFYSGEKLKDIANYGDLKKLLTECIPVTLAKAGEGMALLYEKRRHIKSQVYKEIDVAFPIVHGTNVEDGTIQGFFHTFGIPYVGSDVTASAVGMDKSITKCVLKEYGLPVLLHKCFSDVTAREDIIQTIEETIPYPVIIKPMNLGSSIGIGLAHDREELKKALDTAFCYAERILAEKAIVHLREINCAVLGDDEEAQASECEEPIAAAGILDYDQKYLSEEGSKSAGTMQNFKRKLPADIPDTLRDEIRKMAVQAFQCLHMNGIVRIDFMLDTDTNKLYINEINTIPGSLAFYLWEAVGITYPKLIDKMISLSLKRKRRQSSITFTFDTNLLAAAAKGKTLGKKT